MRMTAGQESEIHATPDPENEQEECIVTTLYDETAKDPEHDKPMPIGDLVLEVLVKKKPFRHIDHDAEDIITREESIERIYKLTFLLAILFACTASSLVTTIWIQRATDSPTRVVLPNVSNKSQNFFRIPGILLVYHDGTLVKLALKNNKIAPEYLGITTKEKDVGA